MAEIQLQAQERTITGKKVKRLRAEGWVPAVMYGAVVAPRPLKMEEPVLFKALQSAGATALIDLFVEDEKKPHTVIARDIQRDILTGRLQHVDFYQVRLDHKIKISPALEIVGVAPAVEEGAILVQILNTVEIECLPSDLIDSIEVDVSGLLTLNDSITVSDLPLPPGVTILADPSDAVVSVVAPRAALEEEEVEEEFLPEGVEVLEEDFGAEDEDEA